MKKEKDKYISKKCKDILHIFVPIFDRNIYYINTSSIEVYKNVLRNQLGITDFGKFNENAQGNFSVYETQKTPIGIIRCSKKKITDLVHECLHATFWIMDDIGISLCQDSEEIYCYTQSMILSEILKS